MTALFDFTNHYTRRARLSPALIVALPLGLTVLSWSPDGLKSWMTLWSLFVWTGGTALVAQLARDSGREKEKKLFELWGGKPTTQMLRIAGSENKMLAVRRHAILQKLFPDLHIPSEGEEAADPASADDIYDLCVRSLLERTRDQKKFNLVFEENCNYGFRRNLLGMKRLGVAICLVGILSSIFGVVTRIQTGTLIPAVSYAAIACILCLLLFWIGRCSPNFVKITAYAYAERLLASSELLISDNVPPTKKIPRKRHVD